MRGFVRSGMGALLLIALATPSAVTLSETARAERWDANSELDDGISTLLREARSLERAAKRARDYDVVGAVRSLLDVARVFKIDLDNGASNTALRGQLADLLAELRTVERRVEDSSAERQLINDFEKIERAYFYMASLLGQGGCSRDPEANGSGVVLTAKYPTVFKATTAQSYTLPPSQKCMIPKDCAIVVTDSSDNLGSGHAKVRLAEKIPGCDFGSDSRSGYIYSPHFRY